MFSKIVIVCALVAAASAVSPGYIDSAYALGAQAEHTVRGFGGVSSFSKQAKLIDSPYTQVRKTDIRVTNDAAYGHPVGYAHHGFAPGYAAPVAHGYHAPAGVAYGHGYASPLAHGYAAPAIHHGYAAPAVAHGYAAPAVAHHGYAAPAIAHHAPLGYGVAKAPGALGVAYSPATVVATSTFSGHGVHYGY